MKIIIRIILTVAFLAVGFAAGLPVGQSIGFTRGSEWALVQAGLLAKEAGLDMPVSYDGQHFMIVMKQPRHIYKRAWKLAKLHEDEMANTY